MLIQLLVGIVVKDLTDDEDRNTDKTDKLIITKMLNNKSPYQALRTAVITITITALFTLLLFLLYEFLTQSRYSHTLETFE